MTVHKRGLAVVAAWKLAMGAHDMSVHPKQESRYRGMERVFKDA